jgi:capsular polysaccharide biosynthesis protein
MSYRNENNLEQQVSLKYFLSEILDKWYIILLITLISVAIQFIDAKYFTTPTYDSTAKIYIMNKQSESVSSADISISTYLAKDYEELIKDKVILEEVSKRLGGVYSAKQIKRCLGINNPESTRILEITVRTGNANNSKKIADCICQVAQEKIVELLGIDRVTILGEGYLNTRPSSPNIQNRVLLGFLIGMAISLITIAFFCFSNSKIKSEQDVNNMLNLSVLATIPYSKKNTK